MHNLKELLKSCTSEVSLKQKYRQVVNSIARAIIYHVRSNSTQNTRTFCDEFAVTKRGYLTLVVNGECPRDCDKLIESDNRIRNELSKADCTQLAVFFKASLCIVCCTKSVSQTPCIEGWLTSLLFIVLVRMHLIF